MSVSLHVSNRNQWRVLSLTGRVDAFSDKRIVSNLRQSVPNADAKVVLNLERCEFLSLYTLKALLTWKAELADGGGSLSILSPADSIRRHLDIFLGQGLPIFNSWEALEVGGFFPPTRMTAPTPPSYFVQR